MAHEDIDPFKDEKGNSRPIVDTMAILDAQRTGAPLPAHVANTQNTVRRVLADRLPYERNETRDLVTGKMLVNIPMSRVSQQQGEAIYHGLMQAEGRARTAGKIDLRPLVESCDRNGPFPGFMATLTEEERAGLATASPELADRCYKLFIRQCLAQNTHDIMRAADAAIDEHVMPAIDRVHSPDTKRSVQEAVGLWKHTIAHNPWRNLYHRTDRVAAPGQDLGQQYGMPLYFEDERFFSIGKMDEGNAPDNAGAGYEPFMGLLLLRDNGGRPFGFLEALDIIHELTHKKQHNAYLRQHGHGDRQRTLQAQQQYTGWMNVGENRAFGIIEEEAEAWGNCIELLFSRIGFGTMQVMDAMQKLGVPLNDERSARHIHRMMSLAVPYYSGGARKGEQFPAQFVRDLETFYRNMRITLMRRADLEARK